jgi:hypothetical protein
MSDQKIADSLGIEFVEPKDIGSYPPMIMSRPNTPEPIEEDQDLIDDFETAREALVTVLEATKQGAQNLAHIIAGNSQEVDMYEALSKISTTTVSAATALVNLHRIKKQVVAIGLKASPKGDQTLIVEGDVVMQGTMGDILDKIQGE